MTETLTEPTAVASPPPRPPRDARYYELKREIEEFLYDEAEMLDQRRFREWLDTLAEDLVYFMPMMFNVKFGQHETREKTRYEKDMSWFNEGKWTLTKRADLVADLKAAVERGYTCESGEYLRDLAAIAVPIRDYTRAVVGSLAISAPEAAGAVRGTLLSAARHRLRAHRRRAHHHHRAPAPPARTGTFGQSTDLPCRARRTP